VILVFQPAEEGGAGAKKIVEAGVLENVGAIFGLHVSNLLGLGQLSSREGLLMAGSGRFKATISGKGGHAALPQFAIDPVLAASNVILSLQHLVSREADPLDSQVYIVTLLALQEKCLLYYRMLVDLSAYRWLQLLHLKAVMLLMSFPTLLLSVAHSEPFYLKVLSNSSKELFRSVTLHSDVSSSPLETKL